MPITDMTHIVFSSDDSRMAADERISFLRISDDCGQV